MIADVGVEMFPDKIFDEPLKDIARGSVAFHHHPNGWKLARNGNVNRTACDLDVKRHPMADRGKDRIDIGHKVIVDEHTLHANQEDCLFKGELGGFA